jgi:hypothetical protein
MILNVDKLLNCVLNLIKIDRNPFKLPDSKSITLRISPSKVQVLYFGVLETSSTVFLRPSKNIKPTVECKVSANDLIKVLATLRANKFFNVKVLTGGDGSVILERKGLSYVVASILPKKRLPVGAEIIQFKR